LDVTIPRDRDPNGVMNITNDKIYNSSIISGSLLMEESRNIADLLLKKVDSDQWYQAIVVKNILQKRSPVTAKKQANLIKNRLVLMDNDLWSLVRDGSSQVASQALLSAAIKHSRILGDFMNTVLRRHWQTFTKKIDLKDWNLYLEQCAQIDPKIDTWKDTTRSKLKQIVFRILAEAKYIENTQSCKLIPVSLTPEIKSYLVKNKEDYVLRCMDIT
jgi:hypothetical protein